MPSRQISTAPASTPTHHKPRVPPIGAAATTTATALSLLFFFVSCFRKISRKRTAPEADSKPPYRFRYSLLRRATDSFSPSRRLGQGGFGPVFYGTLPKTHQEIAVKIMDSGSLQGEREFQNELFFASLLDSQLAVSVLGFSSDRKRRRMLLVYEFMSNGNLQDALLHRKCPELMDWNKRLSIAVDIAKGLQYLHGLETPIIHGDVKPSNILLDRNFSAKIADFGLARLKLESQIDIAVDGFDGSKTKIKGSSMETIQTKKEEVEENGEAGVDDYGSVVEETESVITTAFEELQLGNDQSPDNFVNVPISQEEAELASPEVSGLTATSPEASGLTATSPEASGLTSSPEVLEKGSMSEGNFDKANGEVEKQSEKRDWWWKQDSGAEKRDYVMEWIGTEIQNERPKNDWTGTASTSGQNLGKTEKHKKKNRKQLEWWLSMDEEKKAKNFKKDKRRPAREWWKEEFCEELAKKKKKKMKQKGTSVVDSGDDWWPHDEDLYLDRKKKNRSRSWGSKNSIDWWLDGLSGELWRGKRNNSIDSTSGEIPKSGGISSTPSMRGTVCYVAPEYGFGENPSEKCDVYSFGVLLLVLISGRRPLQVTNSPLSEYQRANLLSWARHLARAGKLIDLVDKSIQSLDHEQALVCIKIALLCLRKLPAHRPSMKQVFGMLTGELEPPQLPAELSPSPQSRFPFKTHKKYR